MADDDFDADEGAITVNAALLEIGGKLVLGQAEIQGRRARRKRERLRAGGAWSDSGCMFTT
jgi:hypothetical protein